MGVPPLSVFLRARLRLALVAALVAALLASVVAEPLAARAAAPRADAVAAEAAVAAPVPVLNWRACGEGFECARARVPLDYDDPTAGTISLALIRLPASGPGRTLGSVFLNPGGPGGSGVDFVRQAGPFLFSDEVRARFDLIGFDPRGIGRSTPLRCFDSLEESFAATAPFAFPVTRNQERFWVRADEALARACERNGGPILDHMATANVARDLDLLREAVGDRRLNYAGYSYGSYLGVTYANLFPNRVRALIVDAVLDPIAWATGNGRRSRALPFSTRIRSDQGASATLRQLLRLCNRAPSRCAFSDGNPRKRFARLAAQLRERPLALPDGDGGTFQLTYSTFVAFTLSVLYDPALWPDYAQVLQELTVRSRRRAAANSLARLQARLGLPAAAYNYPNIVEGFPGVACSDTDNPARVSAWQRAAARSDRAYPYFGRLWTWRSSNCRPWPGEGDGEYDGPFDASTAEPVLVIGNRFDPATRLAGAATVADLLPRSRLVTLDGWGHTSLFQSGCVDRKVNEYLLTTRVPRPGRICVPDAEPFERIRVGPDATAITEARAELIPPFLRRAISLD